MSMLRHEVMNYLSNVTEQVHTLSGASAPALPPRPFQISTKEFMGSLLPIRQLASILPKSDSNVPNISTKVTEGTHNVS